MIQGHITISREFFHSLIWTADKFTIGQALLDLMQLATYKESLIVKRGISINIQRGEVAWSEVRLAERWNVSRGKVRRMLKQLESIGEIEKRSKYKDSNGHEQQITHVTTVLRLINFEKYQKNGQQTDSKQDSKQDSKRTANRTTDGTYSSKESKESKESLKENKKENKKDLFPNDETTADEIFKIHPRKGNKKASLKAIRAALKKHPAKLLFQQTKKYKELVKNLPETEKKYLYGSVNFFEDEHFLPDAVCWKKNNLKKEAPPQPKASDYEKDSLN